MTTEAEKKIHLIEHTARHYWTGELDKICTRFHFAGKNRTITTRIFEGGMKTWVDEGESLDDVPFTIYKLHFVFAFRVWKQVL